MSCLWFYCKLLRSRKNPPILYIYIKKQKNIRLLNTIRKYDCFIRLKNGRGEKWPNRIRATSDGYVWNHSRLPRDYAQYVRVESPWVTEQSWVPIWADCTRRTIALSLTCFVASRSNSCSTWISNENNTLIGTIAVVMTRIVATGSA